VRFRAGIVSPSCPSASAEYMLQVTPQPRAAGWRRRLIAVAGTQATGRKSSLGVSLMYRTDTFRIAMAGPADMAKLTALIEDGALDPMHIAAILVKTEGNGGVNDFTREYTCATLAATLAPYLRATHAEVERRIAIVVSGGTEGVLSPHATVFARTPIVNRPGTASKRLAIGIAATRDFLPHEIGRAAQIEATAAAVAAAMAHAGIVRAEDVHWVQVKCPLLTAERVQAARSAGHEPVTEIAYKSMAYSRGASALGVAAALGEIPTPVAEDAVLSDWSLASAVASASAGIELKNNVVIVLGNADGVGGDCVIAHAVMQDAIDGAAVLAALRLSGAQPDTGAGARIDTSRIVQVLAKADPSPDGMLRGFRHTMLDDTDISATRHVRAAVGGMIASLIGCPAAFVSGGAEHQGPPGGGPVAVIARVSE
jgi:cyanuric acid amidohydrolase